MTGVVIALVCIVLGLVLAVLVAVFTPDVDRLADPRPRIGEPDQRIRPEVRAAIDKGLPRPDPEPCVTHALCHINGHTRTWPCVWAPGTGAEWLSMRKDLQQ